MAKPKNKKSTIWPGKRGRGCSKKVDSQGEHFTCIHDRFLRDPVYRQPQLAIGWSEQQCEEWDEFAKETIHTNSFQREGENSKDMVSYSEQSRQKWAYEASI